MKTFIRESFPDSPANAVMTDTGFKHMSPVCAADLAHVRSAEFGLKLTVVRNQKRTYLEMVERRGMFPSPQYRQCTSDVVRKPHRK